MGYKAGTPVSKILEDSYQQPDGIAAYVISIVCWVLAISEILLRPHLTHPIFWERVHLYGLALLLFPLAMLAAYIQLNMFSDEFPGKRWIAAAVLLAAAVMFTQPIFFE